jgi:hypothetical protein
VVPVAPPAGNDEDPTFAHADRQREPGGLIKEEGGKSRFAIRFPA